MQPFIIYGLPRSRTSWLSMFLSYKDWTCHHEKAMHMRSMDDVKELFAAANTGSVETGAPYGRCLLKWFVPNLKEVVILRPLEEVVDSVMKIDLQGISVFDRDKLRKILAKGERALLKIAKDPNVLVVNYDDLHKEEICAKIFEFCLPYKFDKDWWDYYKDLNIQLNMGLLIAYRHQNKSQIDEFKNLCKRELIKLCRMGALQVNRTV